MSFENYNKFAKAVEATVGVWLREPLYDPPGTPPDHRTLVGPMMSVDSVETYQDLPIDKWRSGLTDRNGRAGRFAPFKYRDDVVPGLYHSDSNVPQADLLFCLHRFRTTTRLGLILSRFTEAGYKLQQPGLVSVEVKAQYHLHRGAISGDITYCPSIKKNL